MRATTDRPRTITPAQAQDVAQRIESDPEWFASTILGHSVWSVQRRILRALSRPGARVAVKGCHASGKTHAAAEAVLWTPFAGGIAITTAPTGRQVRRMVWAEINAMAGRTRFPLGGELLDTEFRIAPDCYALGMSTDTQVNFQGFHARPDGFMLLVMDEAPGIQPGVFAAVEGVRAGGDVRVLLLGNPDIPGGPFYEAFSRDRAAWTCLTIDAFETPNFQDETDPAGRSLTLEDLLTLPPARLAHAPRPYLITRQFVLEKYHEWGTESPLWQSKVRGEFPTQSEWSLLPLSWLEAASRRVLLPTDTDAWEAGIDVAGPGEDETVVCVRHGGHLEAMKAWAQPDPRGAVLAFLAPYSARLAAVKVDTVGMGHYFARHLEDHGYRNRIRDVNVGTEPRDKAKYANLKAELYWGLRQHAEGGGMSGLTDQTLLSQLGSIRYSHNARGQVVIESKEEARKRGVKSPDRAEALMLAYATVGAGWSFG